MEGLHKWLEAQLAEHKTEPNSGLGQAIRYLLRHWQPLTLFLRQAGAPLDNNLVERSLKRAVLHRKNSLFYRTLNGAQVGDLFMSLIHACQLCKVNSFDYLTELLRHQQDLAANRRFGCLELTRATDLGWHMMSSAWPKRMVAGHAGTAGHKVAILKRILLNQEPILRALR